MDAGKISAAPRISLITPVWNGMPYLRQCVESVLSQDFQDWELLISDDGSSDGSRDYLENLSDPRIRLFRQDRNQGIFGNLNFLFARARAPLSQLLCQDDFLRSTGSLENILSTWATLPESVGFMSCNWGEHGDRRGLRRLSINMLPEIINPQQATLLFFLFGNLPGNLSNVSLRTGLVDQLGGFKQSFPYAGDFEFWCRAAKQFSFALMPIPATFVRSHPGQASANLNRQGELAGQLGDIISSLFQSLKQEYDVWDLRFHATLVYDCPQRDGAMKAVLKGQGTQYLRRVDENANRQPAIFGPFLRWAVYFATAGGRCSRVASARRILRSASLGADFGRARAS